MFDEIPAGYTTTLANNEEEGVEIYPEQKLNY